MKLKSSYYISEVLLFIIEHDSSVFCSIDKLIGYIGDFYLGNKLIADDFIDILKVAGPKVDRFSISNLNNKSNTLKGAKCKERYEIQVELIKAIFFSKNDSLIKDIEARLAIIYGDITCDDSYKENDIITDSLIISFNEESGEDINFGQIVTLTWECKMPYRVCISNGKEAMDVTRLNSIDIIALFDSYELILYNIEGKVLDKKTISIHYRNNAYCINCGSVIIDAHDLFCTQCGMKIIHETEIK